MRTTHTVRAYGTVLLLWLISLLAQYDRFVISFFSAEVRGPSSTPLQTPPPQLIADLGLSASQYGMLTGFATGLVYALFALPLGFVTERYLRRVWVLAAGCAWWSACMCFQVCERHQCCHCIHSQGLANSFGVMVAARVGMGLGQAAAETLTISLIPDLVPPEQVSVCESFFYTAIYIGSALGGGISTVFTALSISWRWAFIGVGVFGVLLGLVFALLVREPEKGAYLIKGEVRQQKSVSSVRACVTSLPGDGDEVPTEKVSQVPHEPENGVAAGAGRRCVVHVCLQKRTCNAGIREMGGYTYGFFMPGFINATFPNRTATNLIYGLVCAVFGGGTMLLSGYLCKVRCMQYY